MTVAASRVRGLALRRARQRVRPLWTVLLAVVALTAACSGEASGPNEATPTAATTPGTAPEDAGATEADVMEVVVGIPLPLSGDSSTFGQDFQAAYQIWEERANEAFESDDVPYRVRAEFADYASQPEQTVTAIEELVAQGAVVFTGGFTAGDSFAMGTRLNAAGLPFLATGADNRITQQGWENTFRVSAPLERFFDGLYAVWDDLPLETVGLYMENTQIGQEAETQTKAYAEERGLEVVVEERFENDQDDFRVGLLRVKEADPDVLMTISSAADASIRIWDQMGDIDYRPKLFSAFGGFRDPSFLQNENIPSTDGILFSDQWVPAANPGADEFIEAFEEVRENRSPTYHSAYNYASGQVIEAALRLISGEPTPEKIQEALNEVSTDTIFGHVEFTTVGDHERQNPPPTVAYQSQGGEVLLVVPEEFAETEVTYPNR